MFLRLFVLLYSAAMILFHKKMNEIVDIFYKRYSFEGVDKFLFYVILFLLSLGCVIFIVRFRRKDKSVLIWSSLTMVFPIPIMYLFLFVSSIEAIHFFQYAILSWLLITLYKKIYISFFVSTTLGVLDEVYQFLVLYAGQVGTYLDYNDIVLNIHGAVIGIVIYLVVKNPA